MQASGGESVDVFCATWSASPTNLFSREGTLETRGCTSMNAWTARTSKVWLGNRQQFVRAKDVEAAVKHSVRVIDMEAVAFHYRTRDGEVEFVQLAELESFLHELQDDLQNVRERLGELPLRGRGGST